MRSEQEIVRIGGVGQIKTNPVVADEFVVQVIGNVLHHVLGTASGGGGPFEVLYKFEMALQ
jgi:hypothetical protein